MPVSRLSLPRNPSVISLPLAVLNGLRQTAEDEILLCAHEVLQRQHARVDLQDLIAVLEAVLQCLGIAFGNVVILAYHQEGAVQFAPICHGGKDAAEDLPKLILSAQGLGAGFFSAEPQFFAPIHIEGDGGQGGDGAFRLVQQQRF